MAFFCSILGLTSLSSAPQTLIFPQVKDLLATGDLVISLRSGNKILIAEVIIRTSSRCHRRRNPEAETTSIVMMEPKGANVETLNNRLISEKIDWEIQQTPMISADLGRENSGRLPFDL
jgi:hypothetical protein